jgi:tetratricopeptide (TPR) repeat protein
MQGQYENALIYYEKYAEQFPDQPESYRSVGNIHKLTGNFEKARASYEKALLLEPGSIRDQLRLAQVDTRSGNFERAFAQLQEAVINSTGMEKAEVYEGYQEFYELRGQKGKALEYLYLKEDVWSEELVPIGAYSKSIEVFDHLIRLEEEERVREKLEYIHTQLDAMWKDYTIIAYLYYYLDLKEIAKAEKELARLEIFISEYKLEPLRNLVHMGRGRIHELQEEYGSAIEEFSEQLKLEPANIEVYVNLGRCYRKNRQHKEAEEILKRALKLHPYSPDIHFELSRLYLETGEKESSTDHINRALEIWEDADPDFEPAIRAQEFKALI